MATKLTKTLQLLPTNDYTHHQAATDYQQSAADNIRLHAGGNIEQTCGRHLSIDVEQGKQVTVAGVKASFTVQDGNLTIQAAKDIRITGQGGGDINFGQGGGGFIIKRDGTVQLYGNKITLKGSSGVNLNGQVNYSVSGGTAMPESQAAVPLVPRGMALLHPVDESVIEEEGPIDIEIHLEDLYGNQLEPDFELIKGLEWQIESDSGAVKTGIVTDKIITVAQIDLRQRFTFSITGLDFVVEMERA